MDKSIRRREGCHYGEAVSCQVTLDTVGRSCLHATFLTPEITAREHV